MKLTTLHHNPEFRDQTVKLIESSFNYKTPYHFDIDFYPLMAKENAENNHLLIENNQVIGHIGCLLRNFTEGHPIVLLGGIAIDQRFRGKGYFSTLMKHVIDHYQESVALFLLWSDKTELYKKFNFYLSIGQVAPINTPPQKELLQSFEKSQFSNLNDGEKEEIKDLYRSMAMHYTCIERSDQDWNSIFNISSTELYLKRDEDHYIQAYFLLGKGFDLQNVIHEIAFYPTIKKPLLKKLSQANLWLPESEKNFYQDAPITYMASLKIGNTKRFCDFIDDWSSGELDINSITDEEIIFTFDSKEFAASPSDFFQYIWGPYPLKEFDEVGLPIYIAGVDSI